MTSAKHGMQCPDAVVTLQATAYPDPALTLRETPTEVKKQLESEFSDVKYGYRLAAQKLVTKLCLNCNPKA